MESDVSCHCNLTYYCFTLLILESLTDLLFALMPVIVVSSMWYFRRLLYTSDPKFPKSSLCGTLPSLSLHVSEHKVSNEQFPQLNYVNKLINKVE